MKNKKVTIESILGVSVDITKIMKFCKISPAELNLNPKVMKESKHIKQ